MLPPIEELVLAPARYLTRQLELPPRLLVKLTYYMHLLIYQFTDYPHYSREYIRDQIECQQFARPCDVPNEELRVYYKFTRRPIKSIVLMAIIHWFFIGKNLAFIYYTSSLIDLRRPESNFERVARDKLSALIIDATNDETNSKFIKFGCLLTNCSRLTLRKTNLSSHELHDSQFADELIQLPMFAICMHHLRHYWNPLIYTQMFGLITACAMAYFVLLASIFVPLWCALKPTIARLGLDIMCPRVANQRACQEIRAELEAMLVSQVNQCDFNLSIVEGSEKRGATTWLYLKERRRAKERLKWFRATQPHFQATGGNLDGIASAQVLLPRQSCDPRGSEAHKARREQAEGKGQQLHGGRYGSFLEDCLPLSVTNWYRNLWSQAFLLTIALLYGGFLLQFLTVSYTVAGSSTYANIYKSFAHQTRADGCQFWRLAAGPAGDKPTATPIELDTLMTSWTPWDWLELGAVLLGVPAFVMIGSMSNYLHAMNLFNLIIVDLQVQMRTLIELCELLNNHARLSGLAHDTCAMAQFQKSNSNLTPMRKIRDRLYEMIERVLIFLPSRKLARWPVAGTTPLLERPQASKTDLDERIAYQEFALALLLDDNEGAAIDNRQRAQELLLDLLERFHINYRLFRSTFSEHHAPVTTCLVFGHLINYGFAIVGLYWFTVFRNQVSILPIALTCWSLILANTMVILSSRVHAGAAQLEPKFWSLLALTAPIRDARAKHLRYLWIKQLELIDAEGGLALRMFDRFNVTYAYVIQSIIWTSSVVLFTYTR